MGTSTLAAERLKRGANLGPHLRLFHPASDVRVDALGHQLLCPVPFIPCGRISDAGVQPQRIGTVPLSPMLIPNLVSAPPVLAGRRHEQHQPPSKANLVQFFAVLGLPCD
jgi:hypothetical protein